MHEVVGLCAGAQAAAVLTSGGEVYTWLLPGSDGELAWAKSMNPKRLPLESGLQATHLALSDDVSDASLVLVANDGAVYECLSHDSKPQIVRGLAADVSVLEVACGTEHCVLLSMDGRAFSWGGNDDGQLGLGDCDERRIPCQMELPEGELAKGLSCAASSTLILTESGHGLGCGSNEHRQLARPAEAHHEEAAESLLVLEWMWMPSEVDGLLRQIVCAAKHAAAITIDGRVVTWGDAEGGKLGRKPRREDGWGSAAHARPAAVALPEADQRVCAVSTGGAHTVAVTEGGVLWIWGTLSRDAVYSTPVRARGETLGDAFFLRLCASADANYMQSYTLAVVIVPEAPDEEDWADCI